MTIPDFATQWADKLGAERASLTQLGGGINNTVYTCSSTSNKRWVIKAYPNSNKEQDTRMRAEINFLRYAAIVAPNFTPAILDVDQFNSCIIMEHILGDPYLSIVKTPTVSHLHHSACFISSLNNDNALANSFINCDAVDGFSSLTKHIHSIRQRISLMSTDHIPTSYKSKAKKLLDLFDLRMNEVEAKVNTEIASGFINDFITPYDRWVSPSDFGFHNAIYISKRIMFIDFEFAGWDDPSKTVLDFWMQPRVRIPNIWISIIISLFINHKKEHLLKRLLSASHIFELKWAAIILSVLNPLRFSQILLNSDDQDKDNLVSSRLEKAVPYLKGMYSSEFEHSYKIFI